MTTQASNDSSIGQTVDNTSDLIAVRRAKLEAMRADGFDPFRKNWEQTHFSRQAIALFDEATEAGPEVSVAGRIVAFRLMGKASFVKILDRDGPIQAYVSRDDLGEAVYAEFKKLDLGDIIGL
ncbi:MAG TPA: OB-fold nucleic acid binding domain-containing protein, partial [Opitutales bacterium]|nr:OB-fold nucleic acid binding domain-containing protein [Opitutales bacterium]